MKNLILTSLCMLFAAIINISPVFAVDKYWVGIDGEYWYQMERWHYWDGTQWQETGPPEEGDNAFLADWGGSIVRYETYASPIPAIGDLQIDAAAGKTMLQETKPGIRDTLITANTYVGVYNSGSYIQSGGSHTVNNGLIVGMETDSTGTYELNDGVLNAQYERIGIFGTGTFTQTGGTHELTGVEGTFMLGTYEGGTGTYNLQDGVFTINRNIEEGDYPGDEEIGYSGDGYFNQTGGTHDASNAYVDLGYYTGYGEYNLSGGEFGALTLTVGKTGTGKFTQTGGYVGTTELSLGRPPEWGTTGTGTYELSDDGYLEVYGDEYIGIKGAGKFTQTGGEHYVYGFIYISDPEVGGSGTLNLEGGTLAAGYDEENGYMPTVIYNYDTFNFTGGDLYADVYNYGTFKGDGVMTGFLTNAGIFSPGTSPGSLTVDSGYQQDSSGILLIEMSNEDCDVLNVTGTAWLAGTLFVSFLDGYILDIGDSFDILWADIIDGEFDNLDFSSLPKGCSFDVSYNLNDYSLDSVTLTYIPEPATICLFGLGSLSLIRRKNHI